jgi:hypothetical protein
MVFSGCTKEVTMSINSKTDDKSIEINSDKVNDSHSDSKDYSDINIFWNEFKNDLLNENEKELEKFVQFPLDTRGPFDSNPIVKIKREQFKEMIKLFLSQENGLDYRTNREYFKGLEYPNLNVEKNLYDGKNMRIGDMQFTLKEEGWRLTFVYLEEKSYKELGINIE